MLCAHLKLEPFSNPWEFLWGKKNTHLPPNPGSKGGDFKMTMELKEWLPTAQYHGTIALHSSIFAKSSGIPGFTQLWMGHG